MTDHATQAKRDEEGVWPPPSRRNAQLVYLNTNPLNLGLILQIKAWVGRCETAHLYTCQSPTSRLPFRVLDVGPPDGSEDPFLCVSKVGKEGAGSYITLSYRWATTPTILTTASNVLARQGWCRAGSSVTELYMLIQESSGRTLTKPKDASPAISGLAAIYQQRTNGFSPRSPLHRWTMGR